MEVVEWEVVVEVVVFRVLVLVHLVAPHQLVEDHEEDLQSLVASQVASVQGVDLVDMEVEVVMYGLQVAEEVCLLVIVAEDLVGVEVGVGLQAMVDLVGDGVVRDVITTGHVLASVLVFPIQPMTIIGGVLLAMVTEIVGQSIMSLLMTICIGCSRYSSLSN